MSTCFCISFDFLMPFTIDGKAIPLQLFSFGDCRYIPLSNLLILAQGQILPLNDITLIYSFTDLYIANVITVSIVGFITFHLRQTFDKYSGAGQSVSFTVNAPLTRWNSFLIYRLMMTYWLSAFRYFSYIYEIFTAMPSLSDRDWDGAIGVVSHDTNTASGFLGIILPYAPSVSVWFTTYFLSSP